MSVLRAIFATFLVGLGLFSMIVLGMNNFSRWTDRENCSRLSPLAEFVEHDYWSWDCRLPLVDGSYANVANPKSS